jgi:hypothetical protein
MQREHFFDGTPWPLSSRRRRLRVGDMMAAVFMTSLGLAAVSLPELASGQRLFLGAVAISCLGLLWTQWTLASIPDTRPAVTTVVGALSAIIALSVFVGLVVLWFVFPQPAGLFSVMMLVLVVHLATWD